MKPILEETIEQIKGSATPPPKPLGAKDQLDTGKIFSEVLKQTLGFKGKKVPSRTEVQRMQEIEKAQTQTEEKKVLEEIEKEKKNKWP